MAVVVEMRLIGLFGGFDQSRISHDERGSNVVRSGLHGHAHLQVTVDVSIGEVDPPRVRAFGIDCKYLHTVSIKAELHLMRFGETLDMFIEIGRASCRERV